MKCYSVCHVQTSDPTIAMCRLRIQTLMSNPGSVQVYLWETMSNRQQFEACVTSKFLRHQELGARATANPWIANYLVQDCPYPCFTMHNPRIVHAIVGSVIKARIDSPFKGNPRIAHTHGYHIQHVLCTYVFLLSKWRRIVNALLSY